MKTYIIIVILNGLPDEYSTVRTVVEGRENLISLRGLRAQLLAAERRLDGNFSFHQNMNALATKRDNTHTGDINDNNRGWSTRFDNKDKGIKQGSLVNECSACGRRGHNVNTCFKIHKCQICGKHGHLTSTCYQNPEYKPPTVTAQTRLLNSTGPTPKCQICSKRGHTAANCFYKTNVSSDHPSLYIPTCQIGGLKGHVALNCSHITNFAYQGADPPASLTALSAYVGNYNDNLNLSQGGYHVTNTSGSSFPGGFHTSNGASSSAFSSSAHVVHEV